MSQTQQYVIFKLEGESYGIPIEYVKTIEKMTEMTRVPNAPDYLEGVINLRGEVVPIINMRKRFDLSELDEAEDTRTIILELEEISVGMIVDSSSEVLSINNSAIDQTISLDAAVQDEHIRGIGKIDERMIILLNLYKVLQIQDSETLS
ncbi:chemotaxis protein CheW [Isachenkonia alkalipeptolytica]|uniref:Chemotaxis protein CheW n=1 Tax=Isachenkonia alkalipeptolytica TaxID=2565777 RepID=A0AA43XKL7_9CLOT|nr:chemotaxis protein CheW [Isachenkonia alkalipeptolytica]NBG87590.1 chemotaxis protein CheW [Isachenkonia alkalipeptolytica]